MKIQFAHVAYQFEACFAERGRPEPNFQTWTPDESAARLAEAEVIVASGLWKNDWLAAAPNLKYVHVCGAGYDQFDQDAIRARGIRLCNSSGVNVNAVSDHAMALTLTLARQVHLARDRQARAEWRGAISDLTKREEEMDGKTMLVYGFGAIGSRLGRLARAFGMNVVGIRRSPATAADDGVTIRPPADFHAALADADVVVLTCPLTDATRGLVDAGALAAMKPGAYLINVARGPVAVEDAVVAALQSGAIAAAGLDVFDPEPLPATSALWGLENAVVTPHTAGETRRYEANVLDFLVENLDRLARGETELVNQIV